MPRAERLLALLQLLRCHRYPVRAAALAAELGVSPRTLYRDVAALQAQGARVEGAPGVGYLLRAGSTLPPLAFTEDEVEALVLGARWVADRADAPLGDAARHAVAKIRAVLPADRRAALDDTALLVGPGAPLRGPPADAPNGLSTGSPNGADGPGGDAALALVRRAIRGGRKLALRYRDPAGRESARTVWPFALAFFDRARVVVAWCELRQAFRHFRADRIAGAAVLEGRYPRPRHALLREWREAQRIPPRAADRI